MLRRFVAALVLTALAGPAQAQQIRIGMGYGLAFLPLYICEDLKLVEKEAKAAQLDVKPSFERFLGAAQIQTALDAGLIDVGPFGTAPLLAAWEKGKGTPKQIFAISGMTTLPPTLLGNRPDQQSIADLKPEDRIALPTASAPQSYLLRLQAEKVLGKFDRFDGQVVVLSHADAITDLVDNKDGVAAYFASPPFTELALRNTDVHPLLTSTQVMGGKFSFLMLGATKGTIDSEPQMPQIVERAINEAARLIHDDPRRAAQIYLTHEPSEAFKGAAMEAIIRELRDEFGSAIYGVQTIADFMGRHGELKAPPKSWKEIAAPS